MREHDLNTTEVNQPDHIAAEEDAAISGLEVASVEDFEAVKIEGPIAGLNSVECDALSNAYSSAANQAKEARDPAATRVFAVLAAVTSFVLRPDDRLEPYGPALVF